jgi:hypothetical protein
LTVQGVAEQRNDRAAAPSVGRWVTWEFWWEAKEATTLVMSKVCERQDHVVGSIPACLSVFVLVFS